MNERPNAAELLAAARAALTADILPQLSEALRYSGLMIANAIAIAQREIAAGDAASRAELGRCCALLSEPAAPLSGEALRSALASYNRRLAQDIRSGRFDGEAGTALREHLRRTTEEKLAVSNPKALQDR
jgi:hypothetical protein